MRYLVITRDARLVRGLRERGPNDSAFVEAVDAAAAIRICRSASFDGAVLDAALSSPIVSEFLHWWHSAPERAGLILVIAGALKAEAGSEDRLTERSVDAIVAALAMQERCVIDAQRRHLSGPEATVTLTPSETALLRYLVQARRPVPPQELLRQALGYEHDGPLAVVRTHFANLRRKCREAGLPEVVGTVRRTGYYARGLTLQGQSPDRVSTLG